MEHGLKLFKTEGGEEVDPTKYRKMIGSLRYLTQTRPDLCFAVGYLSIFMQNPRDTHLKAIKHMVRYARGTMQFDIKHGRHDGGDLVGYSDSNQLTESDDGKSTSEKEQIWVEFVSGSMRKGNALTKPLPRVKFTEMRFLLGLEDLQDAWN
ncbi:secreted RxLR effector protein 161-like [Bidens hawaiensis]|uniref:secreted RxLR effector protein 161-like n=1 Tax=Bidens hawaiensis TaxID=980011 RepID=UPI00404B5B52